MTVSNHMNGKTVLITGANRGIGLATANGLASMGATLVLCSRTLDRSRAAANSICRTTGATDILPMAADLSSLHAVRDLAKSVRKQVSRLDVLINNAAVIPKDRELSADGFEMQWAVNHFAPFLLTGLLLDLLKNSAPSRIITVTSGAHRRGNIDFDNFRGERGYHRLTAYQQSKLANVLFTRELARRLDGTGVTANCLHPGVINTGLLRSFMGLPPILGFATNVFKKTETGAKTSIYLASSDEVATTSGEYFEDCRQSRASDTAHDAALGKRLWQISEEQTNFKYGEQS